MSIVKIKVCAICKTSANSLIKCERCNLIQYCSSTCQAKNAKDHEEPCQDIGHHNSLDSASMIKYIKALNTLAYAHDHYEVMEKAVEEMEAFSKVHGSNVFFSEILFFLIELGRLKRNRIKMICHSFHFIC